MPEFVALDPEMKVNGTTIMSVVEGFSNYKMTAFKILARCGLDDIVADAEHWYSQQLWLDAFKQISENVGSSVLFQIGQKIPENAVFPPEIDNVEKALGAIDVAYHMNHQNSYGAVLFDPTRDPPC